MTDAPNHSSPVTGSDFYNLSGPELLAYCGADASKWAQAFCRIKEVQGWSATDIDEGLMISWFANAIEHSSQLRGHAQQAVGCGVYNEIAARRGHQIAKGYDAAHDDSHNDGSIARGAAAFALAAFGPVTILADRRRHGMYRGREELTVLPSAIWPWDNGFHFPGPRDALIDAAAMIVAEIERLDRASPLPSTEGK